VLCLVGYGFNVRLTFVPNITMQCGYILTIMTFSSSLNMPRLVQLATLVSICKTSNLSFLYKIQPKRVRLHKDNK
jgi:hypothetical protein